MISSEWRALHAYILNGHEPVAVSLREWALWFDTEAAARIIVGRDEPQKEVVVSTVFLGIDLHGQPPKLFESMIFGGPLDGTQVRYCTWDEAEAGHKSLVEKAKNA